MAKDKEHLASMHTGGKGVPVAAIFTFAMATPGEDAERLVCKYSYKKCPNMRTTKRNGTLHSLCEFHRIKANTLQQVYAKKKKEAAQQASEVEDGIQVRVENILCEPWLDEIDFSKPIYMTEEDCIMLQELL
ncbi:unnamed protein product [Aphanomyces euteiches]